MGSASRAPFNNFYSLSRRYRFLTRTGLFSAKCYRRLPAISWGYRMIPQYTEPIRFPLCLDIESIRLRIGDAVLMQSYRAPVSKDRVVCYRAQWERDYRGGVNSMLMSLPR